MPQVNPDGRLDVPGVTVRSSGVRADVSTESWQRPGAARAAGDVRERLAGFGTENTQVLTDALDRQDVRPVREIRLDRMSARRGPDDAPYLDLEVEAPGDGEGQVMLEVDGSGVVAWHLPGRSADAARTRARGGQVFRIPVVQADLPGAGVSAERGLLGIGARKLLQLLRFPVEAAAGAAGGLLVTAYENRYRPYGLRLLGADGLDHPTAGLALDTAQLAGLSGRPTLLLVHGTFSTAGATFPDLVADTGLLTALRERYEDRVLVFDHPSLHHSPATNARWLLDRVPADVDLVLDVVAHSRGGLVARALTAAPTLAGGARPPRVRTVVHVGTPNAGTQLAQRDRWSTLFDCLTNLAMLYPDDAVSVPLTAVVETVKQVAVGVFDDLDGLNAMDPASPFLQQLAPAQGVTPARHLAVASDFAPDGGPAALRALDRLVDTYFRAGNDLVVPTAGVSHAPGLVVEETVTVPKAPPVAHTTYFRDAGVRAQLATWLA